MTAGGAAAQSDPMEAQRCIWRCQAEFGLTDAYVACTRQRCGDDTAAAPAVVTPGPGASLTAHWVFGSHPDLGRGAFAETPAGVLGWGCSRSGRSTDFRLTNGLAQRGVTTVMFDGVWPAFSFHPTTGAASQVSDTSCELGVGFVSRGRTMYLLPGEVVGSNAARLLIRQGTRTLTISGGADGLRKLGGVAVPLAGAAPAIQQLLAACPAIAHEQPTDCE